MDEKKVSILMLMDLSKAFDSINLNMLLEVFKLHSLVSISTRMVQSYLKGRYQYVSIGDVVLQSLPVDYTWSSMGSILGPVLFTFYINDLLNHSPLSRP